MRRRRTQDQELADNARLLRGWRHWHAEQLQEALAGIHADVMRRLMAQLENLRSARELVGFISAQDWSAVDNDTRATALHEIDAAITTLRQGNGLAPIDDALPGDRDTVFQVIKRILNSAEAG